MLKVVEPYFIVLSLLELFLVDPETLIPNPTSARVALPGIPSHDVILNMAATHRLQCIWERRRHHRIMILQAILIWL